MTQGLYIAGAEPRSGKSVIALGMVEMLSGKRGRIGFFRPVVQGNRKEDNLTSLITRRYRLDIPYEKMRGCSYDVALEMLSTNREEDLLKLILEKFVVPGPSLSLVYPSAGHQSPKVRVFSDFAADLLRRWHEVVRRWLDPVASPATPVD